MPRAKDAPQPDDGTTINASELIERRKWATAACNERGHSMGAYSEHGRDVSGFPVEVSACKSCDMRIYLNHGHPAKRDPATPQLGVVITGQPLHMDCPGNEPSLDA